MTTAREFVESPRYLQTPDISFWRFEDGGDVVVWSDDGSTIAMSAQVSGILNALNKKLGGIPDFTACLVLITAMSPRCDNDTIKKLLIRAQHLTEVNGNPPNAKKIEKLFRTMGGINESLRRTPSQLANLIAAVMPQPESTFLCPYSDQATESGFWLLVASVDRPIPSMTTESFRVDKSRLASAGQLISAIADQDLDLAALKFRLATGVSRPPQPDDDQVGLNSDSFTPIIDQLRDDPELSSIGKTASQVAATMTLPVRPSDHQDLPLGGVSDITNRGNPEKLLATELAADPMMLMARIANGQALYLRRENPPDESERVREILIENSIRTWGQARLRMLSLALGLSHSEQQRRNCSVRVITLAGDEAFEEDLATREGVTRHLKRLNPSRHPTGSIASWLSERDESLDEPVIILTENTLNDRQFTPHFAMIPRPFLVLTVDAAGNTKLIRRTDLGDTLLKEIPLGSLKYETVSQSQRSNLPLFVSLPEPPLRFAIDSVSKWCTASREGVLWIFGTGNRLLRFDGPNKGGHQVLDRCQYSRILASDTSGNRLQFVLQNGDGSRHVLTVDPRQGLRSSVPLADNVFQTVFFDLGKLFATNSSQIQVINQTSGQVHDSATTDGRFRRDTPVSWNMPAGFVEFYSHTGHAFTQHAFGPVRGLQDHIVRGIDGVPTWIADDLTSYVPFDGDDRKRNIQLPRQGISTPVRVERVSSNGDQILFCETRLTTSPHLCRNYRLELSSATVVDVGHVSEPFQQLRVLHERAARSIAQKSVRKRLHGAAIHAAGLLLFGRSGMLQLSRQDHPYRLCLREFTTSDTIERHHFGDQIHVTPREERCFAPPKNRSRGWHLRRLDIGKATLWLDSRGLLHLKRSDHAMQLSLMLNENHIAGWSSHGHIFGPAYFHDGDTDVPLPVELTGWLQGFENACRQ